MGGGGGREYLASENVSGRVQSECHSPSGRVLRNLSHILSLSQFPRDQRICPSARHKQIGDESDVFLCRNYSTLRYHFRTIYIETYLITEYF